MPKKPKAAGADLHRETDDPEPEPEPDPTPDDGGAAQPPQQTRQPTSSGGLSNGLPVSNKTLLLLGVALVVGFIAYRQTTTGSSSSGGDEASFEDPEPERGPGEPDISAPQDDPLQADEQALDWLVGEKAEMIEGGE